MNPVTIIIAGAARESTYRGDRSRATKGFCP